MQNKRNEKGAYGLLELCLIMATMLIVVWAALSFLSRRTSGFVENVGTFIEDQSNDISTLNGP